MYAEYFQEPLVAFADVLTDRAHTGTDAGLAGTELVSGHALPPLLHRFAREQGIGAHRAATTEWSKYFFARLIIPALVVQIRTGRSLDLAPERWRAHCHADGTLSYLVFEHDPLGNGSFSFGLASLIDAVLQPVMDALARACGLSTRVFASNAAMYYAWALEQLKAQPGTPRATLESARALLDSPRRPDGGFNPFHAPFKTLPPGARDGNGEPITQCRRLCCVRDLDPTLALCENCPRIVTGPRKEP